MQQLFLAILKFFINSNKYRGMKDGSLRGISAFRDLPLTFYFIFLK